VPLNAVYTLQSESAHTSAKISLGLTAALRGLGSDTAAFEQARAFAQPNFVHVNLDARLTQALGHGVELAERFSGQLADQPLVSSEQFSAGGFTSVRGYLQSEAIGDDGVSGSLELQSPSLAPLLGRHVDDLRFVGFFDGAALWVLDPLPQQTFYFNLYSTGLGLRFDVLKYIKGEVALAVPLTDGAVTLKYRPRATFSLKSEF
jgi:hemolysin activation/secretion protein